MGAVTQDRERYLIGLSEKLCPLVWEASLSVLSEPEQVFVCVWQLEAEVNNGGFSQFYYNSAGDNAVSTVPALERISALHTAAIVGKANALFPGGPAADRDSRQTALDKLNDSAFEDLDEAFLAYADDLSELLFTFVQDHRANIRGA
jgi:hypothetical protein